MSNRTKNPPDPKRTLTELELVSEQLPDWRMLIDRLHASFDTGDFVTAVRLVDAIALAAKEMDHHPDLDLAYERLDVRLISQDVGGVTSRDVARAHTISEQAVAAGVMPHPERTSVLELGLDSADESQIRPFWAALLDYNQVDAWGETQLRDATGRRVGIWFQPTDAHDSAGTSTCASRPRSSRAASPPRSRPAAPWSTTPPRQRSGCSPTRRAIARA